MTFTLLKTPGSLSAAWEHPGRLDWQGAGHWSPQAHVDWLTRGLRVTAWPGGCRTVHVGSPTMPRTRQLQREDSPTVSAVNPPLKSFAASLESWDVPENHYTGSLVEQVLRLNSLPVTRRREDFPSYLDQGACSCLSGSCPVMGGGLKAWNSELNSLHPRFHLRLIIQSGDQSGPFCNISLGVEEPACSSAHPLENGEREAKTPLPACLTHHQQLWWRYQFSESKVRAGD